MCGIVGLFLKDKSLEPKLGAMLTEMLITMTDRGPDSAGIAIYGGAGDGRAKITVQLRSSGTAPSHHASLTGRRKTSQIVAMQSGSASSVVASRPINRRGPMCSATAAAGHRTVG